MTQKVAGTFWRSCGARGALATETRLDVWKYEGKVTHKELATETMLDMWKYG